MAAPGGQCACGAIRYAMRREPMIVHCCHCTWCQCETGSAFVINAVIEASEVSVFGIDPEVIDTPSASGRGQRRNRGGDRRGAWGHVGEQPRVVVGRASAVQRRGRVRLVPQAPREGAHRASAPRVWGVEKGPT